MTATSSTASAGPIPASAISALPPKCWSGPLNSCRRIRPSTIISATFIGVTAGSRRRAISGAARSSSSLRPRRSRASRASSTAASPASRRRAERRLIRMTRPRLAPAKINLYLHVVGRRADGYHRLDSLVAFADIGDAIVAAPADALSLEVTGPEAAALAGLDGDNLVLKAASRLAAHFAIAPRAALRLDKQL